MTSLAGIDVLLVDGDVDGRELFDLVLRLHEVAPARGRIPLPP